MSGDRGVSVLRGLRETDRWTGERMCIQRDRWRDRGTGGWGGRCERVDRGVGVWMDRRRGGQKERWTDRGWMGGWVEGLDGETPEWMDEQRDGQTDR